MTTERTPAEQKWDLALVARARVILREGYCPCGDLIANHFPVSFLCRRVDCPCRGLNHEVDDLLAAIEAGALTALSAQLAEQRSINAATVEALQAAVDDHGDDGFCDTCEPWAALLADPSKAATEWRTQVAKEAVSPDRLWKAMRSLAERPEHPIVISWAGNGPEFKRGISEVEMTEALSALLSEDSK
jgi:hypothetical protein